MGVIGTVIGLVLGAFQLVMIARVILDWMQVAGVGRNEVVGRIRDVTHRITEPVVSPVRRIVPPVQLLRGTSLDLAFTIVFVLVILLRIILPL